MPKAIKKPRGSKKRCPTCEKDFYPQAFGAHIKKCERTKRAQDGLREYERQMKERLYAGLSKLAPGASTSEHISNAPSDPGPSPVLTPSEIEVPRLDSAPPADTELSADAAPPADMVGCDTIRTEYHPRSRRPAKVCLLDDYDTSSHQGCQDPVAEPWFPFFNTREDFLFAKILHDGHLNNDLSERLIKLVNLCLTGKGVFTIKRSADIEGAWGRASSRLTSFEVSPISVPYKDEEKSFDVLHRSLWEWATDLVGDPQLAPQFHWDAERIFKCNGQSSTRIFNEPWSADAFWDAQSKIPESGKPLGFILYADKTKLSSFGTAKGYPVVARCANLPTQIRNGNGLGGGRVVGWLPIISEDPKEEKKKAFVNFKRAVWHSAFHVVLRSIIEYSRTGCWLKCGDGVDRWLFPILLILSADYEEQCTMALIRGSTAKRPCPICFVNADELTKITNTWTLRTAEHTQSLIQQARSIERPVEREKLLSSNGIRDVDNVFWRLSHSDPHRALSFDRLHSNNSGLFGHHLWEKFRALITGYGRMQKSQVDTQFNAVPRWSGLIHFQEVMNVSFTDGKKFEDISKLIVFVAHNIVPRNSKEGWFLLRCLRSFSIVDLYLALESHTEHTIATGQRELESFALLMEDYIELSTEASIFRGEPVKKWNFPKMHALLHSFDDIEAKGASRNYNTKPNEKLHGPLKKSYLMRTNFRNVAPQILKSEHRDFVLSLLRSQLDEMDARTSDTDVDEDPNLSLEPLQTVANDPALRSKVHHSGHITLRSKQPRVTLASLSGSFCTQLSGWLAGELAAHGIAPSCTVQFGPDDYITEYRSLRVVYESKVDFKQYIDLVYCSPSFHGQERRDVVIVQTTDGFIFARLLFIFTCSLADEFFAICSVQPLNSPISTPPVKDRDLRLHRVRARSKSKFIFAQSIICGVPLIQDFDREGDYLVMDVIDHSGDLFLRCSEIF